MVSAIRGLPGFGIGFTEDCQIVVATWHRRLRWRLALP
jgi:hypothetical protein